MNSIAKLMITFVSGAAAGLAAGYLTAPKSGEKTRKDIAKEYDATKKALEQAATSKLEEAKEILNETVEKQADNGKSFISRVKDAATIS